MLKIQGKVQVQQDQDTGKSAADHQLRLQLLQHISHQISAAPGFPGGN